MVNDKLSFASLFSGCGGFDLGFIRNDFFCRAAYDWDSEAVQNFRANLPGRVCRTDLTDGIPNEEMLFNLDALIAGPPCQGFSTAGKRIVNDSRNHLLILSGVLARRISPKVLVVENVSGSLSGQHSRYWKTLRDMMRNAGYRTHTVYVQTGDLGMAQLRRRVLFFAWRTSRDIQFDIPVRKASHLGQAIADANGQKNHNPRELIEGSRDWRIARRIKSGQKLSNVRGGPNAVATWDIPEVFGPTTEHERTVLEVLRRLRRQDRLRDHGDADPVSLQKLEAALGENFRKLINGLISKGYVREIESGIDLVGTFNGKFRRLAHDKPSCTVDTRFGDPRYFLHPSQERGFTVREAARIQGFHDGYQFYGTEKGQFRLIGNAVPPPLGFMAATIARRLLGRNP